jgi:hypothetical protein
VTTITKKVREKKEEHSLFMDRPLMRFDWPWQKKLDDKEFTKEQKEEFLRKLKERINLEIERQRPNAILNSMISRYIRKEDGELKDWICDEVRKKDILED